MNVVRHTSNTLSLKQKRSFIEKELKEIFAQPDAVIATPIFQESLTYTLQLKGKRIRPLLAMATYELFKDNGVAIVRPACAVELFHAGSLMLDDLPCMDDAALRRGKTTHHLVYGESVTILASAALWTKAYDILGELDHPKALQLVRDSARLVSEQGLIVGQYLDLFSMHKVTTREQLEYCYVLKTSGLFRMAVRYGAVLGDAQSEEVEALDTYARLLGIAFQIRDDIIDATQSAEESGKDAHKDEDNEKVNFVSLIGVDASKDALNQTLQDAQNALATLNRDCIVLIEIIDKLKLE